MRTGVLRAAQTEKCTHSNRTTDVLDLSLELLAALPLAKPLVAGQSAVASVGVVVAAAAQPALREGLGLDEESRVAVIVCEGATG